MDSNSRAPPPSALRRKMSYRKPAPEFIPSPPTSPIVMSKVTTSEPDSGSAPPLPENWRSVINQVSVSIHEVDNDGRTSSIYHSLNSSECSTLGRGSVCSDYPLPEPRRNPLRQSKIPHLYRPPTPPKPVLHRKEKLEGDAAFVNVLAPTPQISEYPMLSGQPSFITEKSQSPAFYSVDLDAPPRPAGMPDPETTILPMFIVTKPLRRKKQKRGCFSGVWTKMASWFTRRPQ